MRERNRHYSDAVCRKMPASASIIRQVPLWLYGILPANVAPLQQLRCSLAPTRTAKRISSPVFCHDTPVSGTRGSLTMIVFASEDMPPRLILLSESASCNCVYISNAQCVIPTPLTGHDIGDAPFSAHCLPVVFVDADSPPLYNRLRMSK